MTSIDVQCDECQATCTIEHNIDDDVYKVHHCPFCGSKHIDMDEDYEP